MIGRRDRVERRADGARFEGEVIRATGVDARVEARDRFFWCRVPRVLSYWSATGRARVTIDGETRDAFGVLEHAWGGETRIDVAALAPSRWQWDVLHLGSHVAGDRRLRSEAEKSEEFPGARGQSPRNDDRRLRSEAEKSYEFPGARGQSPRNDDRRLRSEAEKSEEFPGARGQSPRNDDRRLRSEAEKSEEFLELEGRALETMIDDFVAKRRSRRAPRELEGRALETMTDSSRASRFTVSAHTAPHASKKAAASRA